MGKIAVYFSLLWMMHTPLNHLPFDTWGCVVKHKVDESKQNCRIHLAKRLSGRGLMSICRDESELVVG